MTSNWKLLITQEYHPRHYSSSPSRPPPRTISKKTNNPPQPPNPSLVVTTIIVIKNTCVVARLAVLILDIVLKDEKQLGAAYTLGSCFFDATAPFVAAIHGVRRYFVRTSTVLPVVNKCDYGYFMSMMLVLILFKGFICVDRVSGDNAAKNDDTKCWPGNCRTRGGRMSGWTGRGGGRTRGRYGDQGNGRIDGQGGQLCGQDTEVNDVLMESSTSPLSLHNNCKTYFPLS
nr:hypothetical protein [Tanacetum cinerariifolium]